jgi:type I restriction enzyme S subunit
VKPLGELITLQRGHDLPSQNRIEGDVPIMGSSGITGYHNEVKTSGPGVVVGRSGNSMGEVSFCEIDYWPLNTCLYVTDFKGNDERYIYYLLQTIDFDQFNSGSAQKSLNRNAVYPFEVKTTECKNEQIRIGRVLADLEDKIELNRQTNQTLEQIAQTIFKSWFVDFEPTRSKIAAKQAGQDPERAAMAAISGKSLDEIDQLSPKQQEQLKTTAALFPDALVDSEVGKIPEGWEVKQLNEFVNFQNGYAFKSKDWEEEGIPVVKIGSVKPGLVELNNCSYVLASTVEGLEKFKLNPGDLLVGMSGYPGETGLVPISDIAPYLNQRVGKVLPVDQSKYGWLYCVLRNSDFKAYAESRAHGSAQANVSGKALLEFPVISSSEKLVELLNDEVSPLISKYLNGAFESEKLELMRNQLLPRILTGELETVID